jgi:hypothetical protein
MARKAATQERLLRSNLPPGEVGGDNDALGLLNRAIARVDAVKYALGLAGVAAAAAIIITLLGSWQTAVLVLGGMLVAMMLLFAFARLTASKSRSITTAGVVLLFSVVVFFCSFLALTLSAVVFERPKIMLQLLRLQTPIDIAIALPQPYDQPYIHPRYGYLILYPTNYFTKKISEDNTGTLLSSEPTKLPILKDEVMTLDLRIHNEGDLPLDTFNSLITDRNAMYLTYCALFEDRFVVSGTYYDARMFYIAYQKRNGLLKSFTVTFPTAVEHPMESVITQMYTSFTGERPKSKATTSECKPYKS